MNDLQQFGSWIWLNGTMVPTRDAHTHVLAHGLHYGTSVFEGERAYLTSRQFPDKAKSAAIYANGLLGCREARDQGFDDALFVDAEVGPFWRVSRQMSAQDARRMHPHAGGFGCNC